MAGERVGATPANDMKKNSNAQQRAEVEFNPSVSKQYQTIKLGIDWHAEQYRVVRIIDNAGPEPAQRFCPRDFLDWAKKQLGLAQKVYTCYEAGAGGFVLHRQLSELGVINYVVAPRDLDRDHKGVQNDSTDARELASDLDRFVRGNPKALRLVHVPSIEAEQRRQQSRQRRQLLCHRLSLAAQGRSLLLSQGFRQSNHWWKPQRWNKVWPGLPAWIVEALEIFRRLILKVDEEIKGLQKAIEQAASAVRPKGLGALTLEELEREVCDWKRFQNRKRVGSYAGLAGGLSATGQSSLDLPITKAGNVRLRTLLIELAWRWVIYQSQSKLVQRWQRVLLNPKAHRRARKRAIVAVARSLFVELWRWRTGRAQPQELGWQMLEAAPA